MAIQIDLRPINYLLNNDKIEALCLNIWYIYSIVNIKQQQRYEIEISSSNYSQFYALNWLVI